MRPLHQIPYDVLPLAAKLQLDQACRDFEDAWHRGQTPLIEPLLRQVASAERLAFVQELVLLDLEYRHKGGFPCVPEDYLVRFPELDLTWLLGACSDGSGRVRRLATGDASNADTRWRSSTDNNADPGTLAVGELLSEKYELLEQIGRGGMGVVYKARQLGVNRLVAVKMILAGAHASEASLKRFQVEADAAARLRHEGIVQVHDVGTQAGRPYLIMEYVAGGSLKDLLHGTPWPCRQAADIVERLAAIIHATHEKQIVHRDLKPANVLLTPEGQIKIMDFGLAKLVDDNDTLTQTGEILGTPSYMAPEQARGDGKRALASVDVYALGAILYELLTGRPPFRGTTATDTLLQVIGDKPVPPRLLNSRIDPDLETVSLKCLEKDPDQRYASAKALAEDLGRYRDQRAILARPPGWTDAVVRALGRRDWVARATWGRISLAMGVIGLAFQLLVHWLVHAEQPKEIWWLGVGMLWLLVSFTFVRYLGPRRHELTRTEIILLSWCVGYALSTAALWIALDAPQDQRLLATYYPAIAAITGLGYFVQGSLYWGRIYFFGLGLFALAIVMRFTPDWAALELGLAFAASQGAVGWCLLRKPEEPTDDPMSVHRSPGKRLIREVTR